MGASVLEGELRDPAQPTSARPRATMKKNSLVRFMVPPFEFIPAPVKTGLADD